MRQRSERLRTPLGRAARHAAQDVAGSLRNFLDLVDGLAGEALLLRARIGGCDIGARSRFGITRWRRLRGFRTRSRSLRREPKRGNRQSKAEKDFGITAATHLNATSSILLRRPEMGGVD